MSESTYILSAIERGEVQAKQLLPLVYSELRKLAAEKMANERPGQTLQAPALVHEAYLRLITPSKSAHGEGEDGLRWNSRRRVPALMPNFWLPRPLTRGSSRSAQLCVNRNERI